MPEIPANTPPEPGRKSSSDSWYILVVGLLMVMIMTILAILWIRERRSRIAYQNHAGKLEAELQQLNKQAGMLHNALQQRVTDQLSGALPIQRSEWRYAADFDPASHDGGRFLIEAQAARRVAPFVGPGDLLIVGPGRNAEQPAAADGADQEDTEPSP
jgi:hypothetical protein